MRWVFAVCLAALVLAGCGETGKGVVRESTTSPTPERATNPETPKTDPVKTETPTTDNTTTTTTTPKQDDPPATKVELEEAATLEEGRTVAREKAKRLVVIVGAKWDQQSNLVVEEALKNDEIRGLLKNTVIVKMEFEAPESQPLVRELKIDTLPRMVFYNPDGSLYDHIKGYNDTAWLIKRLKMAPQLD